MLKESFKTVKDNVKGFPIGIETEESYLFSNKIILKEKNLQWMIYTRHSTSRRQHCSVALCNNTCRTL